VYDFLLSADLMVPDPDATMRRLADALGLPDLSKAFRQDYPNHSYVAWFAPVNEDLAIAPTRLEPQGHKDIAKPSDPLFPPFLHHLIEFQGPARPIKTHATVLITRRFGELMEKLERRKLPFRVAPWSDEMPFDRIWVGVTGNDPYYEPWVDGGLVVEVLGYDSWPVAARLPERTWDVPAPQLVDPAPGELIRITERGMLVRDLDDTLRRLSLHLDWEPAGPVEDFPVEGYRRARMHFGLANSATISLMQPTRYESETGRYLATWGPGAYHIRIAANGLGPKADDLASRGTAFTRLDDRADAGGSLLRVDPDAIGGALVEFVEYQA
jgi:hypothetical protein